MQKKKKKKQKKLSKFLRCERTGGRREPNSYDTSASTGVQKLRTRGAEVIKRGNFPRTSTYYSRIGTLSNTYDEVFGKNN